MPPLTPEQFARAACGAWRSLGRLRMQFGLLAVDADGRHPAGDLPVVVPRPDFARHGIEPRHLRVYSDRAEREAGRRAAGRTGAQGLFEEADATEKLPGARDASAQLHTALLAACPGTPAPL